MNKRHAFTLVELLVVIAIISVLAALLLPTLESAVEQSRKMVCAGNLKQQYIGAALYANDWNDALPYSTCPWQYSEWLYSESRTGPLCTLINNYWEMPVITTGTRGAFVAPGKGILFCPSEAYPLPTGNAQYHYQLQFMAYGAYPDQLAVLGSTKLSAFATSFNGIPKVFAKDYTYWRWNKHVGGGVIVTYYFQNHPDRAANTSFGDGSVRQYAFSEQTPYQDVWIPNNTLAWDYYYKVGVIFPEVNASGQRTWKRAKRLWGNRFDSAEGTPARGVNYSY